MFQKLIQFANSNRKTIIRLFQLAYFSWIIFMMVATWANLTDSSLAFILYPIGSKFGTLAAMLFLVVTIPGILGRFGFKHPLITLGVMFRRHTGISMFLAGLAHGMIVSTLPNIAMGAPLLPRFGYELFGILSLAILTPLFLTSNLYSMKMLGKNWKRIHKLIYLAFWLIVLHIGMRGEMAVALVIAIAGGLEILSLVYAWKQTRAPMAVPNSLV